ncbi:hypothetical protein LTS10_002671 [Elasticomyces elasticus]|nr:hypothetical protein LTS10_002671 [Elasticomyces elasticus]
MANQQQVLALPELLEHILLRLPMQDLLFAQKVCKDWQQAIAVSPKIQEALFLRQERVANGPFVNDDHKDATAKTKLTITANPLLLDTYEYYNCEHKAWEKITPYEHNVRLHAYQLHELAPEAFCRRMYITQPPAKLAIDWDMTRELEICLTEWDAQDTSHATFTVKLSLSASDNFGQLVERFKAQVKGSGYDRHDEFRDNHCVVELEDGGYLVT